MHSSLELYLKREFPTATRLEGEKIKIACGVNSCKAPSDTILWSGLCPEHDLALKEELKIIKEKMDELMNAAVSKYLKPVEIKEVYQYRNCQVTITSSQDARSYLSDDAKYKNTPEAVVLRAQVEFVQHLEFFPLDFKFQERFNFYVADEKDASDAHKQTIQMHEHLAMYERFAGDYEPEEYEIQRGENALLAQNLEGFRKRINFVIDIIIDTKGKNENLTSITTEDGNHVLVGKYKEP